jgi:drug/metabolite transporter (DMT)-like permease
MVVIGNGILWALSLSLCVGWEFGSLLFRDLGCKFYFILFFLGQETKEIWGLVVFVESQSWWGILVMEDDWGWVLFVAFILWGGWFWLWLKMRKGWKTPKKKEKEKRKGMGSMLWLVVFVESRSWWRILVMEDDW